MDAVTSKRLLLLFYLNFEHSRLWDYVKGVGVVTGRYVPVVIVIIL